jgi:flagellar export protein FliJ
MKRFVFRLDSIARLRAREETAAMETFQQSLTAERRAKADLDAAGLELDECEQALAARRAGRSSAGDHLILMNAARVQREHCARLAERLARAAQETEAHRRRFDLARRKHEAIVRLHDRQLRAHLAAAQRQEEKEVSDLILSRYATSETRMIA